MSRQKQRQHKRQHTGETETNVMAAEKPNTGAIFPCSSYHLTGDITTTHPSQPPNNDHPQLSQLIIPFLFILYITADKLQNCVREEGWREEEYRSLVDRFVDSYLQLNTKKSKDLAVDFQKS
ncbi:hypothetical protein AOLI_G00242410 [Acnodon oligacanthus]